MDALLRRFLRAAVRRGLAGNWTWLIVAGCTFVLRRALNDKGGVVSTLKISPGERVLISVREPGSPLTVPEGESAHFDEA
jgi:hypothetical protein